MPPSWSPFRWLSPGGARGRLSIFIFHRVLPQPDPLLPDEPDAERFDRLVGFISRHFNVMPLAEAAAALAAGQLPPAAACITFDDGYADNRSVAAPILRRHGTRATFFIATGFIDGGRMFNDTVIESVRQVPAGPFDLRDLELGLHAIGDAASRVQVYKNLLTRLKYLEPEPRMQRAVEIGRRAGLASASELMMTRRQVVELAEMGMEIGAHTMHHPILKSVNAVEANNEICGGRDVLAAWLGRTPTVFAYPNGVPGVDYAARDVEIVRRAGFQCAVSTARGAASGSTDRFQLPRFTPWDRSLPRFALRCAETLLRPANDPPAAALAVAS